MLKKIFKKGYNYFLKQEIKKNNERQKNRELEFFKNGQIPWSDGYANHKEKSINKSISDATILNLFSKNEVPSNYGFRLDERIVEYPWIFANLKKEKNVFLDAGSTFNFEYILDNKLIEDKEKYIYTFYPEDKSFNQKKISYIYGDLRNLPFKNDFFDEIVCQSTIEHIDMDNSLYGYDLKSTLEIDANKSYEYLKVIDELLRVVKNGGQLLLTFPFGKFENHGFFQQFDEEMLDRITDKMIFFGNYELTFFKYFPEGWMITSQKECSDSESFNPHTKKGQKDDFAAHCRGICCVKFNKK